MTQNSLREIINRDNQYTEKELDEIFSYKYKGKTIEEWDELVRITKGNDEHGIPQWDKHQANAEDALTLAKLMIINKKINNYDTISANATV